MEKINFSADIKAPKEKVWEILWNIDSYKAWTSAFMEGSTVETDNWKEGSKVLFGDGKGSGMVSMVAQNKPNEYMSFKHLGMMQNGVEDTKSEQVQQWAGAMENYTLKGQNGNTTLSVDMDISPDFKDYFLKTWPVAMDKIKALAEGKEKTVITISADINAPVSKVWKYWSTPEHIMQWNTASPDWHCPASTNDLRVGGKFSATMAAKDGSYSFDFAGVYTEVEENKKISYVMGDGRKVNVWFEEKDGRTNVTSGFEAENTNSLELQRGGWQAILDNFKKHTETN